VIAYILRRTLYAVPILIGVNLIVFGLFFFVNSPDDMARAHLGTKRVTPEQIDRWKSEHSLNLPYFYNRGWQRIGTLVGTKPENTRDFPTAGSGTYALIVEAPPVIATQESDAAQTLRISLSQPELLVWPGSSDASASVQLDAAATTQRFEFRINPADLTASAESQEVPLLKLQLNVATPAPTHRLILEYQAAISPLSRLTRTVFFQRSVHMLFFQYGTSDDGRDIGQEIFRRIGPSLSITLPAFIFGLLLNIFFAMLVALYRGTYVDHWGVTLCVILMSISALFYIIAGQVLFAKTLRLVPISGFDSGIYSLKFIFLPVLIAVVMGLGGSVRFYRTIFLEEINKDYVRTARAKGLPERTVLFIHTLKNAMIPILTSVVISLPFLFAGSLLLESFFAIPGMGSFMIDAIQRQDFAIVQAMVSLGSFLYVVGLLLTDISYTLVDPRVRLE
jgi:peptide/nickel transport system permease protein